MTHGLGWGPDRELVNALRDDPWMLNSLDNSSSSQAVRNGDEIVDANWQTRDYQMVSGEMRGHVGGLGEMFMLIQAVHRLTPLSNDFEDPLDQLHDDQTALTDLDNTQSSLQSTTDSDSGSVASDD